MINKIKSVDSAVSLFEEYVISRAEALEKGDVKSANRNFDKMVKVVAYLKNEKELEKLSPLLTHSNEDVRLEAACYLLPVNEQRSINVLNKIAKTTGINSLTAETTLSEWQNGNLKP